MRNGIWFCLLAALFVTPAVSASVDVTTETGRLAGEAREGVLSFKGIPYAAAPVGKLRWMPPAPAASWEGLRDAMAFGPACPQPQAAPMGGADGAFSEDCLTLNIWAPEPRGAHKPLPVMVYVHGGAHVIGSSAQPLYDGAAFARAGVILVTLNYRLGNLGYFAHPALTQAAASDAPLGNYALMDQIAALKWVKRNIASFGGDPDNMTLFGESAGGTDVLMLLAIPSARGLYEKAIIQSASRWASVPDLAMKETKGAELATEWGLPGDKASLHALQALPLEKLGVKAIGPGFGPFVDGRLLPEAPLQSLLAGHFNDVPLIIGYNSDEGSLMELFNLTPERIFSAYPAEKLDEARKLYADEGGDERLTARRMFADALFGVSARLVARHTASGAPSWAYLFSYVPEEARAGSFGAPHGGDLVFVFDNFDKPLQGMPGGGGTAQDRQMAKTMQSCWVSFAAHGVPDCADTPLWPRYETTSDKLLELGQNPVVRSQFRKAKIDFQEQNFDPRALTRR